ncbi:Hypothetical protein I595_500 [Croceitalea dokdonensis DOKDO 023]|uniref:Acyltransferase 3 domain-containing protein n=1 Tax=Croceitalea dokdonensis DOKDO 023 TaxID=1300341 RepID=A0A0P7ANP8_9FLAO|nr:acyltransferase family protein [Croceitalea dokdonensis]KPM33597.1 Hypothetical protein I595_500 [Croceitalea dokdonensis DOKDO 023]
MQQASSRLYFLDAIRAWAILMMLQGHFIDGLLDPLFRDSASLPYHIWLYFRGITAPVFFTVSGFVFTYLLIKKPGNFKDNPRIKKGIRRGLQLLMIGYLLRLNIFGLFSGELYQSFYLVDVLHCIGLSILAIIGLYSTTWGKQPWVFPTLLLLTTLVLFLFEPIYKTWSFEFLPPLAANYFTKANGSVFTIIPWLGYATIGAFLSYIFSKSKNVKQLYPISIALGVIMGLLLIITSSDAFLGLHSMTGLELFKAIEQNNYLFIRLGDVLVIFSLFMAARQFLTHKIILDVGSSTLAIYVIHFIILYGSFTGLGLYRFFHNELSPTVAIIGALLFMLVCTYLALRYHKNEALIKAQLSKNTHEAIHHITYLGKQLKPLGADLAMKLRFVLQRLFKTVKR